MENESTFVAPEGVYTVTEEHKPSVLPHIISAPIIYPTRVSTIVVRFPPAKSGGAPGFAQLLGGNKESRKEKEKAPKDDAVSLSSSDTADEDTPAPTQENISPAAREHTLFAAPPVAGKKKPVSRPKHNIKTTSSTFITRVQNAEGFPRSLQSKQGDVTFLFYNVSKSFIWIEAGAKTKVGAIAMVLILCSSVRRSR
jgi:hypothetical protein